MTWTMELRKPPKDSWFGEKRKMKYSTFQVSDHTTVHVNRQVSMDCLATTATTAEEQQQKQQRQQQHDESIPGPRKNPAHLPARQPPGEGEPEDGHDAVVDDVEGGHVALLLPRHEEEGVGELGKLGQVVQPHHRGHPHPGAVRRGVRPLHVLANCGRTIKYQSLSLTSFFR